MKKTARPRLWTLSLAAMGVVYGDIGTSPIYALRECFAGEYGITPTRAHVLGVLSLVFWSLIVIVSLKYLTFIMRADNDGEGGVIALMALVTPASKKRDWRRRLLIGLGLFGASLLYGDGMITPAISVLSAVEGLEVAAPSLAPYVVPVAVAILAVLFLIQKHGTGTVGAIFGPITLVWFIVIAALGMRGLIADPSVLAAVYPGHAVSFLAAAGHRGFFVLGAVFLVVTGSEALYADMGHFGRRPIRAAWYAVVLPALLLNYFGQGALVLHDPATASHPFYALAPGWAMYPLVFLATAATIIASQAVISGAFSLTRQAIQLGYCPRMRIDHTSAGTIGQIYIGRINWILMVATIALVVGFRSSGRLAAAYGVAVTTTMVIATLLFYVVARERWGWNRFAVGTLTVLFLTVDLAYFGANIGKISHGAWFPLVIGLAAFTLLTTWKRGRETLARRFRAQAIPIHEFIENLNSHPPIRVPGRAVYMTGNADIVPPALLHNLKHNSVLHEEVVLLSIDTEESPRVRSERRVDVTPLGNGLHVVHACYGFMEQPNVPRVMLAAERRGLDSKIESTSYFLGREALLVSGKSGMARWRERLYRVLARNAHNATTYFRLPPDQVVELGVQVRL